MLCETQRKRVNYMLKKEDIHDKCKILIQLFICFLCTIAVILPISYVSYNRCIAKATWTQTEETVICYDITEEAIATAINTPFVTRTVYWVRPVASSDIGYQVDEPFALDEIRTQYTIAATANWGPQKYVYHVTYFDATQESTQKDMLLAKLYKNVREDVACVGVVISMILTFLLYFFVEMYNYYKAERAYMDIDH